LQKFNKPKFSEGPVNLIDAVQNDLTFS